MLHHRTTDPAERAWHVVEHEAREAFCNTGDSNDLFFGSLTRYREMVREFVEIAAEAAGGE